MSSAPVSRYPSHHGWPADWLAQQPEDGPVMLVLPVASGRQHDRGVGLEDRRYGRRDGQARGGVRRSRRLGIGPDAPRAAGLDRLTMPSA